MRTQAAWLTAALAAAAVTFGGAPAPAGGTNAATEAAAVKPQTHCPVMGGEINKKLYEDYQGKRVYFCCEGCRAPFKKDPGKFIRKMEEQGITVEAASTNAPAQPKPKPGAGPGNR